MDDNDTTASTPQPSPEGTTTGTPDTVPAAASAATAVAHDVTPTTGAKPRRRGRTALVAGAAVVAAALLAGGGVAVGAAIADDDDDDRATSVVSTEGDRGAASVGALPDDLGAASADDLVRIVDAALAAAPGEVVAIDAERDGTWDVTVIGADRGEAEVTVTADGAATVRSTEATDTAATGTDAAGPQNVLDAATLRMLAEAALTQADGRIVSIDADDDARSPFEVSIATADRGVIEVTLDTDGTVLATETDD